MNVELVIIGSAIVLTIVLTAVLFVLLQLVRRHQSSLARVGAAVAAVGVLLISPGVLDTVVGRLNSTAGPTYVSIDPGWTIKIAPALIAVIIAGVLVARSRPRASSVRS